MRALLKNLFFLFCSSSFNPLILLKDRPVLGFRSSYRKGSVVSVSAPDFEGEKIVLFFQRPIKGSDVKDGKLVPSVWSDVKRRGGKRQTGLTLSFEGAQALHTVLGKTLEEVENRRKLRAFGEQAYDLFSSMEMCKPVVVTTK